MALLLYAIKENSLVSISKINKDACLSYRAEELEEFGNDDIGEMTKENYNENNWEKKKKGRRGKLAMIQS